MEGHTIDEAAHLLKQPADHLRNKILFAGEAHPILKPCVFLSEPTSMRLAHRNANIYVQESGIDHIMKSVNVLPDDPKEAARQLRVNRHWPEDALTPFKYPQLIRQGLFELTFYPEHIDMTEAKESGRIQLYRKKAVCTPSANVVVDEIMNQRKSRGETSSDSYQTDTRKRWRRMQADMRREVGNMTILSQGDLHYLVDSPVSIPLSDIRITDKMLKEYAASEGIILPKPRTKTPPLTIGVTFELPNDESEESEHINAEAQPSQVVKLPVIGGEEVIPIRLIPLITEPEIPPKQLLDCLYNPRWDFLKRLNHCPFRNDWTLIYKELETVANSGTGKQLEQFPKGAYVTRSDFEEHEYISSNAIHLKLDRAVPDTLLILAFEGFDAPPTTPHSKPEKKCNDGDAGQAEEVQKSVLPASEKEHIAHCLEQLKDEPISERIYYLKINTKLTANQIGALLDVSHDTPKCKSRKVTVGKIFKEEALRLGTWEQVKRKKGT